MIQLIRWGICLIIAVSFLNIDCSSSGQRVQPSAVDESEEDVLKLLGISEEDDEQSDMESRVAILEEQLRQKEAEINELKSELVLKDEQMEQLRRSGTQVYGAPVSAGGDYNSQYQMALNQYRSGQYQDAISRFQALLRISMTHSLSDNCQYWTGECYYGMRNFRQAIIEFEKVFTFPNSNKDPDAQLKLGLCYWNFGDTAKAREEFNRLLINYPNSEYVSKAQAYLAQLGQ